MEFCRDEILKEKKKIAEKQTKDTPFYSCILYFTFFRFPPTDNLDEILPRVFNSTPSLRRHVNS